MTETGTNEEEEGEAVAPKEEDGDDTDDDGAPADSGVQDEDKGAADSRDSSKTIGLSV